MDEVKYIEQFERFFTTVPKNELLELKLSNVSPEGRVIGFMCVLDYLRVMVAIEIGKRKGLKERIVCIDTDQKFTLDRLLINSVSVIGSGHLLEMSELRSEVKRGADTEMLCLKTLQEQMEKMCEDREWYVSRLRSIPRTIKSSVSTLSGGLPSLGKNSR
jgi:hypothetical protein